MNCERFIERLVDGTRGSEDPELQRHLSSCLRCYRAAADLRDLPQLTDLLREGQSEPGPGEAFWRSFPEAVSAAWAQGQRQQEAKSSADPAREPPVRAPVRQRQQWLEQLRAWLRRPMPAAFAGAACAAAVAFVVVRPLRQQAVPVTPTVTAPAVMGSTVPGTIGEDGATMEDLPLPRSQGLDDSVRDLDSASLGAVLEGLHSELGGLGQLGSATALDPDLSPEAGSDMAAASEELENLELEGLQALRAGLGRSI